MKISTGLATFAFGLFAVVSPALAGPVEDYIALRTAELINLNCKALKYIEHSYIVAARADALKRTDYSSGAESGKFTAEQYEAWLKQQDETAAAQAEAAGCNTPSAQASLLTGRAVATGAIYRGLVLAIHLNSEQVNSFDRQSLDADELDAANRFDYFLQQVYGASFPDFSARVKNELAAQLPPSLQTLSSLLGGGDSFGLAGLEMLAPLTRAPDEMNLVLDLRAEASRAIRQAQFEVAAESNGYIVQPLSIAGGGTIPALMPADGSAPAPLPVWSDGTTYIVPGQSVFRLAMVTQPDGSTRLMTYGAAAKILDGEATVVVAVPRAIPEDESPYAYYRSDAFRSDVATFTAKRIEATCLGGPCFEFGPELVETIQGVDRLASVELFMAPGTDVPLPSESERLVQSTQLFVYALKDLPV
jgi:hypothetical protein